MKKILLAVLAMSITSVIFASESVPQRNEEVVLARGQPMIDGNYMCEVPGNFEIAVLEAAEMKMENPSDTGIAVKNPAEKFVPVVVSGDRKVRDVDWCNSPLTYTKNRTGKNIKNNTTHLARGIGLNRCWP